jgi:hypothetical protein
MNNKKIGSWVIWLAILQAVIALGSLGYSVFSNYSSLSSGIVFNLLLAIISSLIIPAIFFFIGLFIKNHK